MRIKNIIILKMFNQKKERNYSTPKLIKSNQPSNEEMQRFPRNKSFHKFGEIKDKFARKKNEFEKAYTYTCEEKYPLIICPNEEKDKTVKYCEQFPFYCFTCYAHFFYDRKCYHEKHSFINLQKVEIKGDVIMKYKQNIKLNKRFALV